MEMSNILRILRTPLLRLKILGTICAYTNKYCTKILSVKNVAEKLNNSFNRS